MFDKKKIGSKIKQLRKDNCIRQDELATKIGISSQLLSNIETGYRDVTLDVLVAISEYFFVSLDYLTDRTNTPLYEELLLNAENDIVHESIFYGLPSEYKDPDLRKNSYTVEARSRILSILRNILDDFHESQIRFFETQKTFEPTIYNSIMKKGKYYLQKLNLLGPTIYHAPDPSEIDRITKQGEELNRLLKIKDKK